MNTAKWMGKLTIGMLLSTAGFADDEIPAGSDSEEQWSATLAAESLLEESTYASRGWLYRPVEAISHSNELQKPFADIDFQDNSALGRLAKLRNLSLLTLAESGKTRLFLGVNDGGLVGLHFIAMPKQGDERYLSLARMPYLKKHEPDRRID